ncbi:MAG TPA: MBL fold metallo-hydrolase [Gemmatimonadaceae bacterium]|nr:MBL fold metallo-hydrolase [Gemmatimonadaceae bacterium]
MFFRRFYDDSLAQASYLIGCDATGEAFVVDANRDAEQYAAAAGAEALHITHVTETHIHADFVSGSRELARRVGAKLLLSAEGGRDWQYAFAASDSASLLRDGDAFHVGRVRVDVLHTPGHTPEHLAFLVTDLAASDRPVGLLSGDFVFVGDVGRPDLLERAARIAGTMEAAAHALFRSLQRFRELPDFVQLWPGHGAGSACGKALGAMPQSTAGYERVANWGLTTLDEDVFVRDVLAGQPDPPAYFAEMKRINREGPPILGRMPEPPRVDPSRIASLVAAGDLVVDVRAADAFAEGHVPGSLNIPLTRAFSTWAGWLLPYDRDAYLLAAGAADAVRAAREMAMIGLDRVAGWIGPDALAAWTSGGQSLARVPQTDASELAPRLHRREVTVVDVRERSEWDAGHVPGALHLPLGHLAARLAELPRERPIVVQCQSGSRSAIAASLLLRQSVRDVINLRGGFAEWVREGKPVATD